MAPSVIMSFKPFNPSQTKWMNWVKRLEVAFALSKVTSEEKRKKMLIYHMGMETFETLIEIIAPAELSELSYADIVGRLTLHYDPEGEPQPTETQNCLRFWQRHQQPDEDARSFMEALQDLLAACEFKCEHCDARNRILRNQFVSGLKDSLIQETLAKEANLTDERALEMAKKMENDVEEVAAAPPPPTPTPTPTPAVKEEQKEKTPSPDAPKKKSPPSPVIENFVQKNCYQCTHPYVKNPGNWHLIRLKELTVTDWEDVFAVLKRHGATGLDLRGFQSMNKKMWKNFSFNLKMLEHKLLIITIEDCPAEVVAKMFTSNPNLRNVNADGVQGPKISLKDVENASKLEELRVKAKTELQLKNDLVSLGKLLNLKHLAIVGMQGLGEAKVESIKNLINLTDLEIGNCSDVDETFFRDALSKLPLLQRLRIMGARDQANTTAMVNAVGMKIPWLRQLELVNFEIKPGFHEAIAKCTNIHTLLLTPIYSADAATVVNTILHSVASLYGNLKVFTWIITNELVKIGDQLAADTNNNSTINTSGFVRGQSIPITEPIYDLETVESRSQTALRCVTYFERTFEFSLPDTFVRILKLPFERTWQSAVVTPPPSSANNIPKN